MYLLVLEVLLIQIDLCCFMLIESCWFKLISWVLQSNQKQWSTAYVFVRILVPSVDFGSIFGVRRSQNGNHFLARYWQNLAAKSHWKSCKREPIGTKRDQKLAKGRPKCIKNSGPKKGERRILILKRGRVFGVPFWRHLVDFGCHFGAHWMSEGRSAWCFSIYLALPNKWTNHVFFDSCAAKIWKYEGPVHLVFLHLSAFFLTKSYACQTICVWPFWRHLVDSWSCFGAHWILKRPPNNCFLKEST